MMDPSKTKLAPAAACRMVIGEVVMGDNGEGAKTAPISMTARSGKPIEHWYWGKVVHDMAGMKLAKPRLPIDYCHDDGQVIGYLNHFSTDTGDLVCSGALVPYAKDGDMATEVIYKSKAGVPYEASINFGGDGILCEEIKPGQMVQVNGQQFDGPGIVIREWPLRGVAVCPYGADMNTKSELNQPQNIPVTFTAETTKETLTMPETTPAVEAPKAVEAAEIVTTETAPEAEKAVESAPAEATPAPAAEPAVDATLTAPVSEPAPAPKDEPKPHQRFVDAFGDRGAVWFLDGRAFDACALQVIEEQKAALASQAEQLKALPRGNPAASFDASDKQAKLTGVQALQSVLQMPKR